MARRSNSTASRRMAFLKGGDAQQMQRLRLVRRRLQDSGADSGGVRQVPRLREVARQV